MTTPWSKLRQISGMDVHTYVAAVRLGDRDVKPKTALDNRSRETQEGPFHAPTALLMQYELSSHSPMDVFVEFVMIGCSRNICCR